MVGGGCQCLDGAINVSLRRQIMGEGAMILFLGSTGGGLRFPSALYSRFSCQRHGCGGAVVRVWEGELVLSY